MPIPVLSAARTVCELRDWNVSNLALQKILYIAHMLHLGVRNAPLVNEDFEAWDYGPVVPEAYKHARGFGSGPVRNVFHWVEPVDPNSSEFGAIQEACRWSKGMTPGQLVSVTHSADGAWSQFYKPGVRGIKIPNGAILEEYRKRERSRASG